jgi:hypothetical protein
VDPKVAKEEREEKMNELDRLLEEDLFTIGIIRANDHTDLLSYEDFDRVYRIIQKHANLRLNIILEEESMKRLNLLHKQQNSNQISCFTDEYRQLAVGAFKKEANVYDDLAQQICT